MSADVVDVQREWFETVGPEALGLLGFSAGMRVVDFGCGPGRYMVPLSRVVGDGGRVIAVDRSADGLTELRRRLEAFGRPAVVETVEADGADGAWAGDIDPVDAVLVFDVLQHVDDWEAFFDAAVSILKPEASVYIYPAAAPHPDSVDLQAVSEALASRGLAPTASHRLRMPHANEMVEDEIHIFARRGPD